MSYDIVTLVPSCYSKKSKITNAFKEIDEFVELLKMKLTEWNINGYFETKVGLAYKLKYDQIHTHFLTKCSLVLYVVDFSSLKSFSACLKKINSCQDKSKLEVMLIATLNECVLDKDNTIDVVSFEGSLWRSEKDKWEILENFIKEKLENIPNNTNSIPFVGTSLTLPLPIPRRKSSKIITFFNSLPSKFDIDKKRSFKEKNKTDLCNESVPNIQIFGSEEKNITNEINQKNKEDHSKLSLSSFFRKRSLKARDSGLSMDSSNSNGSGNRKSEILSTSSHEHFDSTNETSPSLDRSPVICTSSLNKTKNYKAKILMFKDKANQVFHSANCLNSPEHKRRKNVENVFSDGDHFSSLQIPIIPITTNSESHNIDITINYRGQSEPPISCQESFPVLKENGIIKYYSWNSDLAKSQDILKDDLFYYDTEVTPTNLESTEHKDSCPSIFEDNIDILEKALNLYNVPQDFIEEDFQTSDVRSSKNDIEEINSKNVNENYFQIQYAPNCGNNVVKSTKPSVTFKIEGLDSLENIMESIQKSCDDMKVKSKSNSESNSILNTFKGNSENKSPNRKEKDESIYISTKKGWETKTKLVEKSDRIQRNISITCEALSLRSSFGESSQSYHQDQEDTSSEEVSSRSVLYRATKVIVGNPFVVITLLTATAITAPIWSTYIPYHIRLDQLVSVTTSTVNRLLNSKIIQSFSSRILDTASISATSTTEILKRQIVLSPQSNTLFRNYRVVYA